jgi:hypothetical protein
MKLEYVHRTPTTQAVAYSTTVPFYRELTVCEHTLIENDNLTPLLGPGYPGEYYPVPGARAIYRLISDGTHIPTFDSGFTKLGSSGDWDGTSGTTNIITFQYDGSAFTYEISTSVLGVVLVQFKGGNYYVDLTSGSDTNSGASWATGFKTIQKAIDTAVEGAGTCIYVTGSATLTTPIL